MFNKQLLDSLSSIRELYSIWETLSSPAFCSYEFVCLQSLIYTRKIFSQRMLRKQMQSWGFLPVVQQTCIYVRRAAQNSSELSIAGSSNFARYRCNCGGPVSGTLLPLRITVRSLFSFACQNLSFFRLVRRSQGWTYPINPNFHQGIGGE